MLYVIFNPNASKGRAYLREAALLASLRAADVPFEVVRTERAKHATDLAAAAADRDRYTAIVAVGGDGTLNEVASGLVGSSTPLGLIPIGTGNDFAKLLDLPPDQIAPAINRLCTGSVRSIDVGVANDRAFINGLGCGFDAQVTVESLRPTRLRGFAVYLKALVLALTRYNAPIMRVRYNDTTIEGRTLLTTIGNGRCHGGGFWLTPQAEIDDGVFDLCYCSNLSIPQIIYHFPKVLRGTHGSMRQVRMDRVTHVEISADQPFPAHIDGEILGRDLRHVSVEIKPGALKLLA